MVLNVYGRLTSPSCSEAWMYQRLTVFYSRLTLPVALLEVLCFLRIINVPELIPLLVLLNNLVSDQLEITYIESDCLELDSFKVVYIVYLGSYWVNSEVLSPQSYVYPPGLYLCS